MDNKARYTLVGFFILIFSIAMIAFVLWLARYDINKDKLKEYRLYVKQSISGLNINSIVYYKGLDIGIVEDIRINPKNLEEIEIVLKVSQPELIKTNTVATIESQGVTGNKTIELSGGTQDSAKLLPNEEGYATIPIKQSFLNELTSQASNIGQKVDIVLSQISKVLDEKNLKNFESILNNTNNSTQNFDKLVMDANQLMNQNIKNSLAQFDTLMTTKITQTLTQLEQTLKNLDDVSKNMNQLGDNVNLLIQEDIKLLLNEFKITAQSAQNVDEVLIGFEQTLEKMNDTIDNFSQNGGDMIFKTREVKYGPGETHD